jgi:ubiquinone/menaquinone biosynthesis C-methylase UbiE
MNLLHRCYYALRDWTSRPEERGLSSAGYWQAKVRETTLKLCAIRRGRLLEIGCGEGLLLSELASRQPGLEIWGLDRSPESLALARKSFDENKIGSSRHLVEGDARRLPFENSFFDTVIAVNLFLCLRTRQDAERVLAEATRVLAPGGRLIVEIRNRNNLFLRLKYGLAKYYDETVKDHPFTLYDPPSFVRMLEKAGLQVTGQVFLDFPVKRFAPIIIFEAKKYV